MENKCLDYPVRHFTKQECLDYPVNLTPNTDTSIGLDYLDWTTKHNVRRLDRCKTQTKDWFNNYFPFLYNRYEHFGTFNFDREWLKNNGTDEIKQSVKQSVKHFKSVIRKRLFGREKDFRLNFFPVVETKLI